MKRSALTQLPNALRMSPSGDAVGGALQPGYSVLPQDITLNAVTANPTFLFWGKDATVSDWPEHNGLSPMPILGTGPLPTVGVASPFPEPSDTVVEFSGANPGQRYASTNMAFGDILAVDFVLECIFMTPASLATGIVAKKQASTSGGDGWRLGAAPAPFRSQLFLRGSSTNVTVQNAGTLFTAGQFHHYMAFCDRDGDARVYRDGVLILTTAISTVPGSLAGLDALTLGTFSNSPAAGPVSLAQASLWQAANLCSGATADQDALALSRFLATGL